MYEFLKNIIKTLIPRKWLFKNEMLIRRVTAANYIQKNGKFYCNICDTNLNKFIELKTGDLLCPICGSLPRNRRLWALLQEEVRPSGQVLDFSPSRCLYRAMKKSDRFEYVSSDWADEFFADKKYDLTAISEPEASFDMAICYHVLEHIEDDRKAMEELHRILKPGGKAIIQTPFKPGKIFEDPSIQTPSERLILFGQEDHVRIYSVTGLVERLSQSGFKVETINYTIENDDRTNRLGLKPQETVLVCTK